MQFNEQHKGLEHPVVIFADFETLNQHISGCVPNPENSSTNKKTHHKCSGYTYTVVSPYFTNRIRTYRPNEGEQDAGENFVESIIKEEKRISGMLKEIKKKKHNLTTDEEKQWEAEKNVIYVGINS